MSLPALLDWDDTRTGLHQVAQVLGAIREAVVAPEPNYVHLGLRVEPGGLTTGDLASLGRFTLDLNLLAILYDPPGSEPVGFSLTRHNQVSLADAIVQTLIASGHDLPVKREKITGQAPLNIDPATAADFAGVLSRLAALFERLRASLPGKKSPVIVWPHGFDLSFLWFATEQASEDAPHMSFGFTPASAGLDRPYFYTYPYPLPARVTHVALPPLARWYAQNWTGALIEYDDLIRQEDLETVLEDTLRTIHAAVAPLLQDA